MTRKEPPMTAKQFKAIRIKAKAGQATRSDIDQVPNIMDKIALSKLNVKAIGKQWKAGQATKDQVSQAFNLYFEYAQAQDLAALAGRRAALNALNNKTY